MGEQTGKLAEKKMKIWIDQSVFDLNILSSSNVKSQPLWWGEGGVEKWVLKWGKLFNVQIIS